MRRRLPPTTSLDGEEAWAMFKQELERGLVVKKHPRSGNPADRTWLPAMLPPCASKPHPFSQHMHANTRSPPLLHPATRRVHSTRALATGLVPRALAHLLSFAPCAHTHTPCATFRLPLVSARSTVLSYVCTAPRRRDVALPGADLLREARQVPSVRVEEGRIDAWRRWAACCAVKLPCVNVCVVAHCVCV